MYFICHVTQQDNSVEMSCIFVGESSLQHITTLKSWHRHSDSYEEKCFIKNMNLINTYCHLKIEFIG